MPEPTHSSAREDQPLDAVQRLWGIVSRRRWWIIGTLCCVPLLAIAVTLKLPDSFLSQATLLLVQPQVSQRFVQSENNLTVPSAVQAMKLEVLTRSRLLAIIDETGLYPVEKKALSPDLLAEKMRKDIEIQALEGASSAFTVAFTAPSPKLAHDVIQRVISLFIEQNQKNRGEQAEHTTQFLSEQLEAAKQRMLDQERRLEAFKTSNLGQLPEQAQANLLALTDARARLDSTTSAIAQIQQQQVSMGLTLTGQLTRLESEKTDLLARFTPAHPEVLKKESSIQRVRAAMRALKPGGAITAGQEPELKAPDDPGLDEILKQARANAVQVASLTRQQEKLQADMEQYQRRLNLAPVREQQLAEIVRDYDLFKQSYTELLKNKLQSQLATSVEENQQGQQFRLVDPPMFPEKPTGPKRLKISLIAIGGALFLGCALAFLMDIRDATFHSERELLQAFSVPLVLSVPLAITNAESRARKWRVAGELLAGSAITAVLLAAELYIYRHG